jgi:hypothetical protein
LFLLSNVIFYSKSAGVSRKILYLKGKGARQKIIFTWQRTVKPLLLYLSKGKKGNKGNKLGACKFVNFRQKKPIFVKGYTPL